MRLNKTQQIEVACNELMKKKKVYTDVARKRFGHSQDGEDIFSDVCLTLIKRPDTYPDVALKRRMIDHARIVKGVKYNLVVDMDPDDISYNFADKTETPEDIVIKKEEVAEIKRIMKNAMRRLPPISRDILRLRYFKGLTLKEMVRKKRIKFKAVTERIRTARRRLKEILVEKYIPT